MKTRKPVGGEAENTQSELTNELMRYDLPRICRITDSTRNKIDASTSPGVEGKIGSSLFRDDPWPIRAAHKLLCLYLWCRGRK